jgi:hypothetical protein
VLSRNLRRRHLSESQRAMVAVRLSNMEVVRPGSNRANLPYIEPEPEKPQISLQKAADLLNVSRRSVVSANYVCEHAVAEIVAAVDRGKLAMAAAYEAAKLKPEQQLKAATRAIESAGEQARTLIKQMAREERDANWQSASRPRSS